MKYILLTLLLNACSKNLSALCPADEYENMTEYDRIKIDQASAENVDGKNLVFIGKIWDVLAPDWFRGPTLVLEPTSDSTINHIYGSLPKEIEQFKPSLKKSEKVKISGVGDGGCKKALFEKYNIDMDVWELERVE